jgi:hypothetical protein
MKFGKVAVWQQNVVSGWSIGTDREREQGAIQMMDRERKDKERQEVFEATWRSYRTAMKNAFALQEQTLEFARNLLEGPAETLRAQAESNRATLDALAEQSRKQRETMERLVRESASAYVNLFRASFSYYQEVMEAMTAPWTGPRGRPESQTGGGLPLADYDSLNVREISEKLDELSAEEIEQLRV